ncbi:MAG TPA: SRPBCC domain-containing protein [Pseudomonadales bacterium]|nr:SRPBCC domain-containing protein [Pseudomonadales bacterium]
MGMQIGPLAVRRCGLVAATPADLWRAFIEPDRFAAWFGHGHRLEDYEPVAGGRVRLSVEIDGERRYFGGHVLVLDDARELSFSNNWETDPWPVPTFVTLRLRALHEGTLVELFHHGFERLGARAASEHAAYEAGWHSGHIDALRQLADASSAARGPEPGR